MDSEKLEKENSFQQQNAILNSNSSNPIGASKIMPLNTRTSANRLYGGFATNQNKSSEVNYNELIASLNQVFSKNKDFNEVFYTLCEKVIKFLNLNFMALGIFNETSNYLYLKLIDKLGANYNSRILSNELDNPIVKAFNERNIITTLTSSYLKLNYLADSQTHILPLISFGECLGVIVFSDNTNQHIELYKLIANFCAISYKNLQLNDLVVKSIDIDSLTSFSNHKKMQEDLAQQIKIASENNTELAFCIFDIANISSINSELGHAKGDEVIKEVAQRIKKNARANDILGRYGGDEIAIIMPDTNLDMAKYLCEYLTYNLSCTMFDDLGQLKFSCGVSMYPSSTDKQDKLTILAEQAVYIAKSKRSKSGQSEIVSTNDFNFWDSEALKSFAHIVTKKHACLGINLEEELITRFHDEKIISNEHMFDVVLSLANTIDAKDTYTKGHSTAVSRYAEALARAINLPEAEVERIKLGALLHDIGKIGIPENVLRKPTMLSDDEWAIMKQHPSIGANKVLKPNKALHDLIPMVEYHHEHLDGTGYPYGLKGDQIPQSARIVAIADAFHALISDRPYRKGMNIDKACEILKMGAGNHWDKELIRQFIIIAPSLATNI